MWKDSNTGKEYDIDGAHEPLISSVLFGKVQMVIDKRKRKTSKRKVLCEELILRGFLSCPECGKNLTGSASKGRSKKYHYYHCHPGCNFRVRADEVNHQFVEFLKKLKANEPYTTLVGMIQDNFKTASDRKNEAERVQKASMVEKFSDKMVNAHDLFVKGDIDYDDYLLIQSNCKRQIKTCVEEVKQLAILSKKGSSQEIFCVLNKLYDFYTEASLDVKRELISYMLPEKAILLKEGFDEMVNEPTRIVFNIKSSNPKHDDQDNESGSFQVMDEKYLVFIENYFMEKKMVQPTNLKNIVVFLKKITLLIIRG
ncbi:zinc ribbon domain-containing protein [Flavobacterium supellecticarium]|nr:zinc ribbon domain-containing protein [Flavobacterium supellecticarium]